MLWTTGCDMGEWHPSRNQKSNGKDATNFAGKCTQTLYTGNKFHYSIYE